MFCPIRVPACVILALGLLTPAAARLGTPGFKTLG